jgi:hypothetical protein
MVQGIVTWPRAVLTYARSYTQKTFFGPPKVVKVLLDAGADKEATTHDTKGVHFALRRLCMWAS